MARTVVKTTTSGWFIDAADPDGPRVRKKDGDTVISLDDFQQMRAGDESRTPSQQHAAHAAKSIPAARAARNGKPEQTEAERAIPTTTSETGKILRGKTTEIKCGWKGDNGDEPVCGRERTIKVQDQFQVKYCVEHQTAHRRKVKREKLKAKRQAAKAAVK